MSNLVCPSPGVVSTSVAGAPLCLNGAAVVEWETPVHAWDAVDPVDAAGYFGAGLTFTLVIWGIGRGIAAILSTIRSL